MGCLTQNCTVMTVHSREPLQYWRLLLAKVASELTVEQHEASTQNKADACAP